MKKLLLSLSLVNILFIDIAFCQKTEPKPDENIKSGFYAGLNLTPALIIRPEFHYFSGGMWNINLLKGAQVGINIKKRIDIQVGFEFFSDKYTSKSSGYFGSPTQKDNYFIANYDVNFFQVPVLVKTYLSNKSKKLQWYIPLGLVYRSQQAEERLSEYFPDGKIFNTTNSQINKEFLYYHLGVGSQYKITEKFNLFVETNGRIGLWYKQPETRWKKFYNSGVNFGLTIGANYYF